MLPGGHQPRITRLSKAITAVLVIVAAIEYYVPSTSAYIALVPGRCASSELQLALDRGVAQTRNNPNPGIWRAGRCPAFGTC